MKFPYYTFPRKSPLFGKSINRDDFHKEFEKLLKQIQPKEDLVQVFEEAVLRLYKENKNDDNEYKKVLQGEINQIN